MEWFQDFCTNAIQVITKKIGKAPFLCGLSNLNWAQLKFISNSFSANSVNDLPHILAMATVVETLADAFQVALLVQLPHLRLHPSPKAK